MTEANGDSLPVLLADIGGTHARFALHLADETIPPTVDLPSAAFRDLASAAREGLSLLGKHLSLDLPLRKAAVAVAGPITGDEVRLTNADWRFSIDATRAALGLDRLVVINDLAALAWAVPALETRAARDGTAFTEGKGERQATGESVSAVIAVGTGLGAATHVRSNGLELVLPSEAGHGDLAATSEREWRVVERLASRFGGHVSVERAVSGSGLANLWTALAELDDPGAAEPVEPDEVTRRAAAGEARAGEAVSLCSGWLGAFAGDFALAVGARSGVWIGGGVLAALGSAFDRAAFGRRFRAKGRFEAWLSGVTVRTIDDPQAAFRGLARCLEIAAV